MARTSTPLVITPYSASLIMPGFPPDYSDYIKNIRNRGLHRTAVQANNEFILNGPFANLVLPNICPIPGTTGTTGGSDGISTDEANIDPGEIFSPSVLRNIQDYQDSVVPGAQINNQSLSNK
jgi:hypothetical protein